MIDRGFRLPTIRFNDVPPFLDEIRTQDHRKEIRCRIVRLAQLRCPGPLPQIKQMSLVSTFLTAEAIVELELYCGDLCGMGHDEETFGRLKGVSEQIERLCHELGLTVRAGVIEA